ncbi:13719_t:CDS:2, partial [Ambispora leptoticha]
LPLAIAEFFGCHMAIFRILIRAQIPDAMMRTPYFSSIFQASAFWVGVTWLTKVLMPVLSDPGFIPKLKSHEEQKQSSILPIEKCWIQDICVPRVCNMQLYISQLSMLVYNNETDLLIESPSYEPIPQQPCVLTTTLCGFFQYDTWTASLTIWASIQLSWSFGLLIMQSIQIASAKTTNEMANFHRYSYFGQRTGSNVREQIMATLAAGPGASDAAQVGDRDGNDVTGRGSEEGGFGDHARVLDDEYERTNNGNLHSHHNHGILKFFVSKRSRGGGLNRAQGHPYNSSNPFDFGCWNNCVDFWTEGRGGMLHNVDWLGLFDVPLVERNNNVMMRRSGGYVAVRGDEHV